MDYDVIEARHVGGYVIWLRFRDETAGEIDLERELYGAVDECLAGERASATVQADMSEAARWGIRSTPTFLIGKIGPEGTIHVVRRLNGAQPFEAFREALQSTASDGR